MKLKKILNNKLVLLIVSLLILGSLTSLVVMIIHHFKKNKSEQSMDKAITIAVHEAQKATEIANNANSTANVAVQKAVEANSIADMVATIASNSNSNSNSTNHSPIISSSNVNHSSNSHKEPKPANVTVNMETSQNSIPVPSHNHVQINESNNLNVPKSNNLNVPKSQPASSNHSNVSNTNYAISKYAPKPLNQTEQSLTLANSSLYGSNSNVDVLGVSNHNSMNGIKYPEDYSRAQGGMNSNKSTSIPRPVMEYGNNLISDYPIKGVVY